MDEREIKDIETADFDFIENILVAIREVWRKRLLVLLITIAGFLIAIIFISIRGNSVRYYSSATLFSAVYGSYSDTNDGVAAMNRYTDLIRSSRVCNRAAQALTEYNITAKDLQKMISDGMIKVSGASTKSTSYGYKLTISVFSDAAEQVNPITNAMASAFANELNDLIGKNAIQVMDEATGYSEFNTLNTKLYMLVFPGAAFVLTCAVIFAVAFLSPWVRSVAQCEQDNDLILGLLPYAKNKQN